MRISTLLTLAISTSVMAFEAMDPEVTPAPKAEVRIGSGVEKHEVIGASDHFKMAAGTKVYAWTKVVGASGTKITIAFHKDGKFVSKQKLEVPRSPYRTHAYRTFRKGDGGAWTAKIMSKDGKALGAASFKVELTAE